MIYIYSTLSKKKEELNLIRRAQGKQKLSLFVCGVTTYDFSHIGHARTYIAFDMIAKYLRYKGYNVFYLQNITDIDDKIIKRANEAGENAMQLSRRFEKEYMEDMKALGINSVSTYARATNYIKEIVSQVERLLKKEYAYEIKDDGVYFNISKFKEYGKLSGRTTEQAQDAVSRIDESVSKRNKGDFALWKFVSLSEKRAGVPAWKSPWGEGRPGWHIEDTAISEKFFGAQYDIHGGAVDLIFPHHEAEITQMESISGKSPLVNYWMHTGFLTVGGEKMSKSLGNFVTIRNFLENHSARLLRYLVLKTHYRSPIDYSPELLTQAQTELDRIDEFAERLHETRNLKHETKTENERWYMVYVTGFVTALEEDLNTPLAISVLFDLVREGNTRADQEKLGWADAKEILNFLKEVDSYFGFIFWGKVEKVIPAEIKKLAEEREQYRKEKNWSKSDELRDKLLALGWSIEDTSSGPKFKRLK